MNDSLSVGLLHLDVKHRCLEENRETLAAQALEAARRGAKIIVAPELAVSGYSFENREDISACVETLTGATFGCLAPIAKHYGAYICVGIAERDPATDIFYNSAIVVGPDGEPVTRHRKIAAAERRWACPGEPDRCNIFDTPWGRVGVLICADTYFGLLPRSMALNSVDLLLVSANWPPLGVDPRLVWRARAIENGFGVVGCNRTGMDRFMDCRACRSYVVLPTGEVLLDEANKSSTVWTVNYPLIDGKLASEPRKAIMASRRPEEFTDLYLDVNGVEDFGGLWGLPAGGPLEIRCLVPESRQQALSMLETVASTCNSTPMLLILPQKIGAFRKDQIAPLVNGRPLGIIAEVAGRKRATTDYSFISSSRRIGLPPGESFSITEFGPARIALVRSRSLIHPEVAVSLSKRGCDLLVTSPVRFDSDDRLLFGIKCLERAAVAVVAPAGAMVCEPPVGHAPWKEELMTDFGVCSACIDTAVLRGKRFQDRVDMETLLRR